MKNVCITGMGVVTPLGSRLETLWQALLAGQSAVGPLNKFDASYMPAQTGAQIAPLQPDEFLSTAEISGCLPSSAVGLHAARQALADADLLAAGGSARIQDLDLLIGSSSGQLYDHEHTWRRLWQEGAPANPLNEKENFKTQPTYEMVTSLARNLGLQGHCTMNTSACSAGAYVISLGAQLIRSGKRAQVLCGGIDLLAESVFAGFCNLRQLAPDHCRPFDSARRGLAAGEGAAMLVLESEESCRSRGARPRALIKGWGWSNEAHHPVTTELQGQGILLAMQRALQDAGLSPREVDCVLAHGQGTRQTDQAELQALQALFAPGKPMITAVKSMLGHARGASSAVETVVGAMIIDSGMIPAVLHLDNPEAPLDFVRGPSRRAEVKTCLANTYGFGGNNASVVLCRPEREGRKP
ncbi:beta-ketoacyl-[acyl-carrier-protein] synthase family protein [candidate division FCPU426 bacterium]|nr:beta-ketoacyl-[acyl-carrier-protein] synthase family protein [candidate division FCPU426 bacterium]